MKRIVLGTLIAVCMMVSAVYADGPSNNVNFFFGQKSLSDDWDTVYGDYREQAEFCILFDFKGQDWPLSLAIELIGSAKEDDDLTGSTGEFCVGVKKIWEESGTPIKPFVGIGLASMSGKFEARIDEDTVISSEKTGVGYFMEGGAYFTIGENLNLGALVRYSYANASVDQDGDGDDSDDLNLGGTQAGIFIGYHW
jgi:opacity protein-like surface antigen